MRGLITLIFALVLFGAVMVGCTTRPVVSVPTPVPCRVELPDEPDFAFDDLAPGSDIFTQVKTLLADREQRIAYERELAAAARSCS